MERLRRKARKRIVGLMSGTSADGIGAVCAVVDGAGPETRVATEAFRIFPYSAPLRERLLRLTTRAGQAADVCLMNFVLGELYARAAGAIVGAAGVDLAAVDLIGMDGHTIQRVLPPASVDGIETGGTLQIGEPAVVAERTGVTTVAQFRTRDVAAGGEGAPISSFVDFLLFRHPTRSRAVLNLGGISAATIVPAGADVADVFAVTTGPGNMVIDGVVRRLTGGAFEYDVDGQRAGVGRVREDLLAELMSHPFFSRPPPKSAGRELFGAEYVDGIMRRREECRVTDDDLVATVTAFTAEAVASQLASFVRPRVSLDDIVVGGGGVHNPTLLAMLRARVGALTPLDAFGVDVDAKEPLMFAILANEALHGRCGNVPGATGARRPVVLGSITSGAADGGDATDPAGIERERPLGAAR